MGKNTNRRIKIKKYLREYKEKLGCKYCGEYHVFCLEFHHIDQKQKKFNIGTGKATSMVLIKAEVKKCDVVCANCHKVINAKGAKIFKVLKWKLIFFLKKEFNKILKKLEKIVK